MRGCLDEGILQSYFDGELSREQMQAATSHLATCQVCSAAALQLENETTLLVTALAPEFEAVVPTEHLRQRIDEAIAGSPLADRQGISNTGTLFGWIQSFVALFTLTPQRELAYAGLALVVVFGVIFGIIQRQQSTSQPPVVQVTPADNKAPSSSPSDGQNQSPSVTPSPSERVVKNESSPLKPRSQKPRSAADNQTVAQVKLMPGERSYLKTIAALDSTIKDTNNDRPMRSSLRAEYERNLAVVNRALAATRNAAKNNPNDPDAKEFMFDAYQSKVDLLNTVADARSFNRPQ